MHSADYSIALFISASLVTSVPVLAYKLVFHKKRCGNPLSVMLFQMHLLLWEGEFAAAPQALPALPELLCGSGGRAHCPAATLTLRALQTHHHQHNGFCTHFRATTADGLG